jgi:YbgC/YbaW family acyl-CoA thioester hydrolase
MAYEFKLIRRVEFSDTDMAGIVHYSNFFRYMEAAEHGFFRSLGFSVVTRQVDPPVGWPRVHAECDYKQPLRFEDEVEIHMLVSAKKSKSLSYTFRFRKLNGPTPVEVAHGSLTVVCVTHQRGKMKAATIPKAIADKIQAAPAAGA